MASIYAAIHAVEAGQDSNVSIMDDNESMQ